VKYGFRNTKILQKYFNTTETHRVLETVPSILRFMCTDYREKVIRLKEITARRVANNNNNNNNSHKQISHCLIEQQQSSTKTTQQ